MFAPPPPSGCAAVKDLARRRRCFAQPPAPPALPSTTAVASSLPSRATSSPSPPPPANRSRTATAKPTVYPRWPCNHAPACPFVNKKHLCLPPSETCRARFGAPRVEPRHCAVRWNSTRFADAFAGRRIYFVGDSIAAQQWRSLLCLEIGTMSDEARKTAQNAAHEKVPHGTTCVALARRTTACAVRSTDLPSVLKAATPLRGQSNAVLVLSAFAHQTSVTEAANVRALLQWLAMDGPLRARVVWRSREADHYGDSGWNGTLEMQGCRAASAAQRSSLAAPFWRAQYAPLERAGVLVLDSRSATEAAHEAHPLFCDGSSTPVVGFWDCRHFCQPGPMEQLNVQLVDLFDAG